MSRGFQETYGFPDVVARSEGLPGRAIMYRGGVGFPVYGVRSGCSSEAILYSSSSCGGHTVHGFESWWLLHDRRVVVLKDRCSGHVNKA